MRYVYEYDAMNRISRKSASGRTFAEYTYDLNGNRSSFLDITGKKIMYTYDMQDRLKTLKDQGKVLSRVVLVL